jgi:hypothetical protein
MPVKFLLALLLCGTLEAAPTFNQVRFATTASSTVLGVSITTSVSNSVLVATFSHNVVLNSVSFAGQAFTILRNGPEVGGVTYGESLAVLYPAPSGTLGNVSVSVATSGTIRLNVSEYTNLSGYSAFTYAYGNSGGGSLSVTLTTTTADSMICGGIMYGGSWTGVYPSGWTGRYNGGSTNVSTMELAAPTVGQYNAFFSNAQGGTQYMGSVLVELLAAATPVAEQLLSPVMWNSPNSNMFPQQRQRMR